MSKDEIRKLLGGYATNSLTGAERKALFEAALDDQELFDAMQEEQALKDLLDDPTSREQIRQALVEPVVAKQTGWWTRWWTWGAVAGVAAASIAIVSMVTLKPRLTMPAEPTVAMVGELKSPAPAVEAPAAKPKLQIPKTVAPRSRAADAVSSTVTAGKTASAAANEQTASKDEAPPAPVVVLEKQLQASPVQGAQMASSQRDGQQIPPGPSQNANNFVVGGVALARAATPALRYSIAKRLVGGDYVAVADNELQPGDALRLNVTANQSGVLALYRLDNTGSWKRVFPASGPGLPVMANTSYSIPDSPIDLNGADARLRLVLTPAASEEALESKKSKAGASGFAMSNAPPAPIVREIVLHPRGK